MSNITITNIAPAPGSTGIERNQTFTFTIQSKFQANPDAVYVILDNKPAITAGVISSDFGVVITPNGDGYDYSITPNYLFADNSYFNLEINAADAYGDPAPTIYASYVVIDTRPALLTQLYPMDGYIDVPLDLNIHFLINQLIAPNVGLDGYSLNVYVDSIQAVSNGVIQGPFNGSRSSLTLTPTSDIITPFEILLEYAGRYSPNDIIVVSVSIKDNNGTTYNSKFSFITAPNEDILTTPVFSGYFQGIYFVDNLGNGKNLNIIWHTARATRPEDDLAYLIYYSTTRSDVFYEEPKIITQGRKLTNPELVKGAAAQLFGYYSMVSLTPGQTYYFGVRATEFPHSATPVVPTDSYGGLSTGLITTDGYSFAIPAPLTLTTDSIGTGAIILNVSSTKGFASAGGYVVVGSEIMRYTSLTLTTFVIASTGRGMFGTTSVNHFTGETLTLYYGNMDDNSVIEKGVVTWESPNDPHRVRPDLLTTNFTLEDGYNSSFEPFDYCSGYHNTYPDELFTNQMCNTYVGGLYNGHHGLNLYERMLATQEQLLSATGQPCVLLKRLWSGEACFCRTSRKDNSRVRACGICMGTGFKGGYIQYLNPRRDDQKIMVHFAVQDEQLNFKPQAGVEENFEPQTWTLSVPSIKDRDVVITLTDDSQIEWIYVVDAVSRTKSILGKYGRQKLKLTRLDRTDILYQYKIIK